MLRRKYITFFEDHTCLVNLGNFHEIICFLIVGELLKESMVKLEREQCRGAFPDSRHKQESADFLELAKRKILVGESSRKDCAEGKEGGGARGQASLKTHLIIKIENQ